MATVRTYRANEIKASCCASIPSDDIDMATGGWCRIQGSNGWNYRTFLQYDLSGLPANAVVKSAYLYTHCRGWGDYASNGTTNIARVTSEWEDTTASWDNMPTFEGRYLAEDVSPHAVDTWGSWDITSLVTEWIDGTYPNYGLHIVNNNEDNSWKVHWDIYNHFNDEQYGTELATYILIEYVEKGEEDKKYAIKGSILHEIASLIRKISGTSEFLSPSEMVTLLEEIADNKG